MDKFDKAIEELDSLTKEKDTVIEEMGELDKKKKKTYYTANFDDLCDLVEDNGEVKFLTFHGKLLKEVVVNGKTYLPPDKEKLAFDLPNYAQIEKDITDVAGVSDVSDGGGVCSKEKEIFNEIMSFHEESAELPDKRLNILITAWDIHTHLLEKFGHSPIVFFAGLPEKGKSRMATSMLAVARRGVRKASVTDAQIIREASDQGATIFFDMTDFWNSIKKSGSEDVVLSRFERGLKVGRVLNPEKGAFEDMTYYNVFGPTIIASNDTIEQVLGSRTISIVMKESKRKFKKLVDEKKGKLLRDKLIAIRLKYYNKTLPNTEKIVDGRFGDILRPLHQIVKQMVPELEQDFIDIVQELQKKRQMTKSDTVEGEIVRAILQLEIIVNNGILPVKEITDKVNSEKSEKEKLTYQKIGRKLDIMGYQKAKTGNGSSAIEWNKELNKSLAIEHSVEQNLVPEKETSTLPVTSETPETPATSDKLSIDNIDNIFNKNA